MTTPFSSDQRRALAAVLNEIIPPSPERGLPGAGDVLLEPLQQIVEGDLRGVVEPGLAAADELARGRGATCLAELEHSQRRALLDELAVTQPALVPSLLFHAFSQYYQAQAVVEALGLEHRPPHPKGYEMEPFDESLLEPVRQRGKRFRTV